MIQSALRFALDQLKQRFGDQIPAAALDAVWPLLMDLLKGEMAEWDEQARAYVQANIDDALRKAGLI